MGVPPGGLPHLKLEAGPIRVADIVVQVKALPELVVLQPQRLLLLLQVLTVQV